MLRDELQGKGSGRNSAVFWIRNKALLAICGVMLMFSFGCKTVQPLSSTNGKAAVKGEGAFKEILHTASTGDASSQFAVGEMYENGKGTRQSLAEATKWYGLAARQGYAPAQGKMGYLHETGKGAAQDDAEAVKWYRLAAEQGDASGQSGLGYMIEKGRGATKSFPEALALFRKAAEQGDARGQWGLGYMYLFGRGVPKSDRESAKWYRLAADQGYAPAQAALGFMYAEDRGVEKSDSTAVRWYRKAAEQGYAYGQHMLGYMYDTGRGVSKDDAEAAKYYRLAAEQGQATAQSNLGIFYKNGRGVAKSHVEAARWLRKAIDGGNKNALQQIQGLYDQHGYGIGKPEEGTFTLEDYLKSNSLTVTDVRGSKNGGFILTRAVSADKKEVDFSLWRYDESKQTFVRSWFSVRTAVNKLGISFDLSKDALTVLLHSQPDAHFLEVIKKNREKRIPVLWLNSTNRLTGTQTVFVALNSDGSEAALIRQSHVFWHVQVYSTSTGVPVRSQKVDYKNSPDKILYDHQNRYIAVQENVERHNTTTCYVFDTAKLETLKSWYGSECLDSSQDGTLLALRDKSGTKLIDTSGWNEIGQTNQAGGYGVAFGMDHKLVRIWNNAFEECILKDGKLMPIQRHYEDTQGAKAVYVAPANVWYAFRNGEIFKLKTATHEMKDAGVLTAEGVELLKAGFHEEGIRKLKQAVHRYPLTTLMNSTDFYVRLEEKNVPLKYIGDLLLSYVAEQLKAATEENKPGWGLKQEKESVRVSWVTAGSPAWRAGVRKGDAIVGFNGNPVKRMEDISFKTSAAGVEAGITVLRDSRRFDARLGTVKGVSDEELLLAALRRLTNYAMFAVQAGHPYLAKQAADRIRQIQKEYPADLYWEEKIKRAVALEAVSLAATQSPDQAYDHIMKLNGLIHDHEADISAIIVGYPGYWLPLYADRKKLAYILKMEESKLPTPKVVQRSVQPYPDLTGSLIEPVTAPPELRVPQQGTADEAQPVDTPPAKGRVLD